MAIWSILAHWLPRINKNKIRRLQTVILAVFYLASFNTILFFTATDKANADSIIHINSASAVQNSASSSITINKPTGTQENDVMVAAISYNGNVTISAPLGWSNGTSGNNGTTVTTASFYKVAGSSEGSNYTFTMTGLGSRIAGGIVTYRGVDTADPLDVAGASGDNSSSTSATAPTITTGVDHAKVIGVFGSVNTNSVSYTPPTGMIERVDTSSSNGISDDAAIEVADYHQSADGSTGAKTATVSASSTSDSHLLSLNPDGVTRMMLFWDGTGSPPTGWSYVTEAEGKWIRGETSANYGSTGGNANHTPSITVSHVDANLQSGSGGQSPAGATAAHTHVTSGSSAGSADNERNHRTLRLIRYDAGIPNTIPAGAITIFDSDPGVPATDWTTLAGASEVFNARFIKAATTPNSNGGSDTHSHSISWSLGTATGSSNSTINLLGQAYAPVSHTHSASTNTTTNGTSAADCDAAPVANSCLPPYIQVMVAKADVDTEVLSLGLTAFFDGEPGGGWVVRSQSGGGATGVYYQRFLRGGATYDDNSTNGFGATTHEHIDQTATSGGNTGSSPDSATNTTGLARQGHTHGMTADFAASNHIPPYFNVVIAEKVNFILAQYAWYDDNNAIPPSSRWGNLDIAHNSPIISIPTGNLPPDLNTELRLRIQILVNNNNLNAGEIQFKLQFSENNSSTDCTTGTWTDVGNNTDITIWKYVGDGGGAHPTDGFNMNNSTDLVAFSPASNVGQRYVRSNAAGTNPDSVNTGQRMEWDYHIMNNGALGATHYSFRLVEDSGILLSQYGEGTPLCPHLTTKPQPGNQLRHGNFFESDGSEKGFSWVD